MNIYIVNIPERYFVAILGHERNDVDLNIRLDAFYLQEIGHEPKILKTDRKMLGSVEVFSYVYSPGIRTKNEYEVKRRKYIEARERLPVEKFIEYLIKEHEFVKIEYKEVTFK